MEETICIIVCKGAYVDTPGSDYLFQKKRVFRISESAVFRYGQQKEVARIVVLQTRNIQSTHKISKINQTEV